MQREKSAMLTSNPITFGVLGRLRADYRGAAEKQRIATPNCQRLDYGPSLFLFTAWRQNRANSQAGQPTFGIFN
jgi:hypothetical protein